MPFDNPPVVQDNEITRTLVDGYHRILNGWCKKALSNAHGEFCAVGALRLHDNPNYNVTLWWRGPEIRCLWAALPPDCLPAYWADDDLTRYSKVVEYNNDPLTTKDDILRLFERAIMLSRTNA